MPLGIAKAWQFISILKHRIQARTAANFRLRILLLLSFSAVNILLGGIFYKWTAASTTWSDALFTVYAVLWSIPGADVTNAPSLGGTVVLNLIFIFGLLVFATILAMITEEVNSVLLAARSGKAPLVMSGHILLLNWNCQVPFLLHQLELLQRCNNTTGRGRHPLAGRPLVILADKGKEDMDALVVEFMKTHRLEVHTRTGKPYKLEHLERVSAASAAAVLVLHPESASSAADAGSAEAAGFMNGTHEPIGVAASAAASSSGSSVIGGGGGSSGKAEAAAALKMQTVMALAATLMGRKAAVVVQVPESTGIRGRNSCQLEMLDEVLALSGQDVGLLELPVKRMVKSLAVQATLQPWAATIYSHILQHSKQPDLLFHRLPPSLFSGGASRESGSEVGSSGGGARRDAQDSSGGGGVWDAAAGSSVVHGMVGGGGVGLSSSFSLRTSSTVFKRPSSAAAGATGGGSGLVSAGSVRLRHVSSVTAPGGGGGGGGSRMTASFAAAPSASFSGLLSSPLFHGGATGMLQKCGGSFRARPPDAVSYDDLRVRYSGRGSVPIGFYRSADQQLVLNPEEGSWCEAADVLVCLAHTQGRSSTAWTNLLKPLLQSMPRAAATGPGTAPAAAAATAAAAAAAAKAATANGSSSSSTEAAPRAAAAAPAAVAVAVPAAAPKAAPQPQPPLPAQQRPSPLQLQPAALGQPFHTIHRRPHAPLSLAPINESGDMPAVAEDEEGNGAFPASGPVTAAAGRHSSTAPPAGQHDGAATEAVAAGSAFESSPFQQHLQQQHGHVDSPFAAFADHGGDGLDDEPPLSPVDDSDAMATPFASSQATAADPASSGLHGHAPPPGTAAGAGATASAGAAAAAAAAAGRSKSEERPLTSQQKSGMMSQLTAPMASGLRSAPSWLFSARKLLQQQDEQQAQRRLSLALQSSAGSIGSIGGGAQGRAGGHPVRRVLVAGFTAEECGNELLPHFLDFAPPGTTLVFAVGPFEEPPPEFDYEGTVEEDEAREGREPVNHLVHYRFVQTSFPLSAEGLKAAGLLEADSVLLAAEESARRSPAEADAQVLGALVEIQHALAHSNTYMRSYSGGPGLVPAVSSGSDSASTRARWSRRPSVKHRPSPAASHGSDATAAAAMAAAASAAVAAADAAAAEEGGGAQAAAAAADDEEEEEGEDAGLRQALLQQSTPQRRLMDLREAAADAAVASADAGHGAARGGGGMFGAAVPPPPPPRREREREKLHVVACVANTASKALAASFFGAMAPDAAAAAAAAAANSAGGAGGASTVVSCCLFSYELIVPGEVESAVLVQVANEPLYTRVVHELLGTPDGCELYLLAPAACGCTVGETLKFSELQAVGRLLSKTVVGVVAGGRIVLAPEREWRWHVQAGDRVAAIALSWDS